MSTSLGRCSSNALISGSLQDVWPPTIAYCFVAIQFVRNGGSSWARSNNQRDGERTRTILGDNAADRGCFNTVYDIVARPRDEMAVAENLDFILDRCSQH